MPYLIDGDNLLHAARRLEDPRLLIGRAMLCAKLAEWSRRRRERVHVVFDGPAPGAGLASQIAAPGIVVEFSGAGVSADEVIARRLEDDSAARRLQVVSTDHEVARAARRRDAKPLRSDDFWQRVMRDLARPKPPQRTEPKEKEHGLDPADTQRWLREFGME